MKKRAKASRLLREEACAANIALFDFGLAKFTFGNASAIDQERGLLVIKPSGVPYEELTPKQMVVTDLEGHVVEGSLRPSSDLPTHALLARSFPSIGGIAHTHSMFATSFAQARREIPCLGTTHADYFHGPIPVTRALSKHEVTSGYELNTGQAIVTRFAKLDPSSMPAVLVANHAPFTWGKTVEDAVANSAYLEEVAELAWRALSLAEARPVPRYLLEKHYQRKHGKSASYGQR